VTVLSDDASVRDGNRSFGVARMLGGFAIVALLLAASGVVGVLSHSVAQRTREFGIRLALGATPGRVLRNVLVREAQLIIAALVSGGAFTFLLTRVMFQELASLSATAWPVWFALIVVCGGTAGLACLMATWRIVRLEPAAVLRRL